jgi:hypothetical protein
MFRRHRIKHAASVDSASLLIIDPCYLPPDAIEHVQDCVNHGWAVLIKTDADGWYPVEISGDAIVIHPAILTSYMWAESDLPCDPTVEREHDGNCPLAEFVAKHRALDP